MIASPDISPGQIERVEFLKRDKLTTDLICCEITAMSQTFLLHEELSCWPELIAKLEGLDGFRRDWFSHVSQPAFADSRFVAFEKVP